MLRPFDAESTPSWGVLRKPPGLDISAQKLAWHDQAPNPAEGRMFFRWRTLTRRSATGRRGSQATRCWKSVGLYNRDSRIHAMA